MFKKSLLAAAAALVMVEAAADVPAAVAVTNQKSLVLYQLYKL